MRAIWRSLRRLGAPAVPVPGVPARCILCSRRAAVAAGTTEGSLTGPGRVATGRRAALTLALALTLVLALTLAPGSGLGLVSCMWWPLGWRG